MSLNKFKHLQEKIRIQISKEYIQHEMRKILPNIRNEQIWRQIDSNIDELPTNKTMAPIRDFWNFTNSICFGLKLKNLVPRLTSQNIEWSKKEVLIDDIQMGSKGSFRYLDNIETKSPNGKTVREFLFDDKNEEILKFAIKDSIENSEKTFDRDMYYILVVEKDNEIIVHDGNRRMIKNILNGNKKITVYYGKIIMQPAIYNHWIPTSLMMSLVKHADVYMNNNNKKAARSLIQSVGLITKMSKVGRTEMKERVLGFLDEEKKQFVQKELDKIWNK